MNLKTVRTAAWIAVVGLAAAYAGWWVSQRNTADTSGAQWAPPFSMADMQGKAHQLSDYKGKLLLVNFWASWCSPCMEEIPHLVEAQSRYQAKGLQILGPAMDEREPIEKVIAEFKMNYPVFPDYTQVDSTLQALGNKQGALPYSVLISRDGKVLETLLGGLDGDQLSTLIEKHL